jgi:hypothetical protein
MNIDFEWQRCLDGYEFSDLPTYGFCIKPKSDNPNRMETYKPLETHTAMLRQVAGIKTQEDILKFTNMFGLLFHPTEPVEPEEWASVTGTMRVMLKEYDQGNFDRVGKYFNELKLGKIEVQLDCSTYPPKWFGTVTDLHRAIWWQFIQMIIKRQDQEVCAWCGTWFAVGADTGRRKRRSNAAKSYCTPRHQKKYEYSMRPKKKETKK